MREITIRDLRADEVEVRVGSVTEKGATYLLYKDARCDMNILDETFGIFGWQREHYIKDGKEFCKVSIWDEFTNQWVSKEDTGTESNTEKEKGQSSDAFKRACFNWGIGRELYTSPFIFISLPTEQFNGKWQLKRPIPSLKVTRMDVDNHRITGLEICNSATGDVLYSFPKKNARKPSLPLETELHLPRCQVCGNKIVPMGGFDEKKIADITLKNTGKVMCGECYKKWKGSRE